ncbi:MAG: HU family DNA-binding protein [Gammaproteobacteria bacterium]|jgi:nucleoid DNA-binding protein
MAKAKKKSTVTTKKTTKSSNKHSHPAKTSKVSKSTTKAATKAPMHKDLLKNLSKPLTRTQQIAHIASTNNLPKKDVTVIMNSLEQMIAHHLKNLGEISIGGLIKFTVIKKPATKAREGINPFTGQPTIFKAKPAKKVVKIRALKKIKDMVV